MSDENKIDLLVKKINEIEKNNNEKLNIIFNGFSAIIISNCIKSGHLINCSCRKQIEKLQQKLND